MPRAGWTKPDTDHRLSDHLAFAMLTRVFPPDTVDGVVEDLGRLQRRNRLLPSRVVVYYVLGLALFSHSSYDEVIRLLMAGQSWSTGWTQTWPVPTKAALYKARLRLGHEPLKELFERVAKPTAVPASGTGYYRTWRVLGIDGATVDVPDTTANEEAFGRPTPAEGVTSRHLKVRILGLIELGTGAIVGATIGREDTEDERLAGGLVDRLTPGCLVIAGPDLYSSETWSLATATGADLMWALPPEVPLVRGVSYADGSYASRVPAALNATDLDFPGVDVRVIEAPHTDASSGKLTSSRFITTITDPLLATASDLVELFTKQRSLSAAFDEFRAHSDSARIVLRSKMPDGVRQELYGFLCVHYAMRRLMNTPPVGSEQASLTQ